MLRFAMVTFLPKELNDLINPIRDHFEPGVSFKIPPHITLHFPFWLKTSSTVIPTPTESGEGSSHNPLKEELYKRLKILSQQIISFEGEIGELGLFNEVDIQHLGGVIDITPREKRQRDKVLYLSVLPKEEFVVLNKKLTTTLKDLVEIDPTFFPDKQIPEYVPHITLAMKVRNVNLTPFLRRRLINVVWKPFLVDRFFVLSNEKKEGMWKIERMFKLGD